MIDSAPGLAAAVNLALGDLGFPGIGLSTVRGFIGNGLRELMRRSLRCYHEPSETGLDHALGIFMRHYGAHLTDFTSLYNGVLDTLDQLNARGTALGCVTNTPELFALPLLEAFGLKRYFPVVVSGDTLPKKKPDPLPFIHANRLLLEAPPDQVLVVGDSNNDVRGARGAGMPVVSVSYGYRVEPSVFDLGADAAIDEFPALLNLLAT